MSSGIQVLSHWFSTAAGASVQFILALVLVQVFDTALPQGDRTDTSIGIVVASLFLLPLPAVVLAVLASRLVTIVYNAGPVGRPHSLTPLVSNMLALAVAYFSMGRTQAVLEGLAPFGSLVQPLTVLTTGLVYLVVQQAFEQLVRSVRSDQRLTGLLFGNLQLQGYVSAAALSISALLVLIYPYMGFWALTLCVMLLLVIRQAFNLLIQAKQAYTGVVRALLQAMEAQRPGQGGHSEKVAALAVATARELGIHGRRAERISYAALFHDIGLGGIRPTDFARQVYFLQDVVPILSILESSTTGGSGRVLMDAAIIGFAHNAVVDGAGPEQQSLALTVQSLVDETTRQRLTRAVSRATDRMAS